MKKLLISLLMLTGCAGAATKASAYCDENWQGRYDTWQSCYDRQLSNQNKGAKAAAALFKGAGDGLQNAQKNRMNCSTWNNQTTCH